MLLLLDATFETSLIAGTCFYVIWRHHLGVRRSVQLLTSEVHIHGILLSDSSHYVSSRW